MEGLPWIRESQHVFSNKNLFDGCIKISSKDTSESSNPKRKVESLFCVMRKRICRHKSVDDYMFPDLDYAEESDGDECDLRFEHPLDECSIVYDSESESSELFDVVSEHVQQVKDLKTGSEDNLINKEDPQVPYNSDIFKNDCDKSSAIEVRYGDVVNMQESMEKMWNKDDEPIPISIVPPNDGWSSVLCSLRPIVRCINECNVDDDNIGLGISSIPLTKTPERPSRLWSVCGSVAAAVRNLPLLDEQLYVNVSDEKLAPTPSTLYQEEIDGEDEISFSDIDAMIRRLNLVPDDSDSCLNREEWNMSKHQSHAILGLEQCTRTSIMSQEAFAVLHGRDSKHFVRKPEVIIGRSSDGLKVDIDLGKYGYGSKISRRQALVKLENNGSFSLKNLGKQHILVVVDGEKLDTGQIVTLTSCSSIDIRGITFVFKINKEAVRQFLKKNNTRRKSKDNTKFRWCE